MGIEPMNRGFADPRLNHLATSPWSGRGDSNPRPPPWQGGVLPLNYFRPPPLQCRSALSNLQWCRGGDLNSYGLTPTTPSRWRVYRFHHLGMAGVAGFEPTTNGFGDRCSTGLSYTPIEAGRTSYASPRFRMESAAYCSMTALSPQGHVLVGSARTHSKGTMLAQDSSCHDMGCTGICPDEIQPRISTRAVTAKMGAAESMAALFNRFMFQGHAAIRRDRPWRWIVSSMMVMPTMLERTPPAMKTL